MAKRLKLTKPITLFVVTQRFGDDLTCVDMATHTTGLVGHNGTDLMAVDKQPVYAATDGNVIKIISEKVKAGELVGYADNTGLSSGMHLHFELKPVRRSLSGNFRNVLQSNGYFGTINPELYF